MDDRTEQVKTYPALGLACLRTGNAKPYRLWLLLRHFDAATNPEPVGRVSVADLESFVASARLRGFSNLRDVLRDRRGGAFWRRYTDGRGVRWVSYARLQDVGAAIAEQDDSGCQVHDRPAFIPLAAFRKLTVFRAHVYALGVYGRLDGKATNPLARSVASRLAGLSKNTMIKYDRLAGVQVRRNHAITGHCTARADAQSLVAMRAADLGGRWFVHTAKGGGFDVCRVLPNSYTINASYTRYGRSKHLRRLTNPVCLTTGDPVRRRYFHEPKRAMRRDHTSQCYLEAEPYHTIGGRTVGVWDALPCVA